VGLKEKCDFGKVKTIVHVQNFKDIAGVVNRESSPVNDMSVYQNPEKNCYLQRSAGQ
jgi:hypothetical protein